MLGINFPCKLRKPTETARQRPPHFHRLNGLATAEYRARAFLSKFQFNLTVHVSNLLTVRRVAEAKSRPTEGCPPSSNSLIFRKFKPIDWDTLPWPCENTKRLKNRNCNRAFSGDIHQLMRIPEVNPHPSYPSLPDSLSISVYWIPFCHFSLCP